MGFASGSCSLIIRGNSLDFNQINNNLGLNSTEAFKKGDVFSKVAGEIKEDVWIYKIMMEKTEDPDSTLKRLLAVLRPSRKVINFISTTSDVCIRCYIQSELAQIGFNFTPDVVKELAYLKIRLEMSILSWGEVEND